MSWDLYCSEQKFNYIFENDILRNYSQNLLGVQMTPRHPAG